MTLSTLRLQSITHPKKFDDLSGTSKYSANVVLLNIIAKSYPIRTVIQL